MVGIALALSLICPASVDTLYKVDFGAPVVNYWVPGPLWKYEEDSMLLHLWAHWVGGIAQQSDTLSSPLIVMPQCVTGYDSVIVEFFHSLDTYGIIHQPGETCASAMRLFMHTSGLPEPGFEQLWAVQYSDYGNGFEADDSGLVTIPLTGLLPGEAVMFRFTGLAKSYTRDSFAVAVVHWMVYSFSILGYTSDRSLEPFTWGSIKSLF